MGSNNGLTIAKNTNGKRVKMGKVDDNTKAGKSDEGIKKQKVKEICQI